MGYEGAPKLTYDEQMNFEEAVRDGHYDQAMQMAARLPELLKHMHMTARVLEWPILTHEPFRAAYPELVKELDVKQQQRLEDMARLEAERLETDRWEQEQELASMTNEELGML